MADFVNRFPIIYSGVSTNWTATTDGSRYIWVMAEHPNWTEIDNQSQVLRCDLVDDVSTWLSEPDGSSWVGGNFVHPSTQTNDHKGPIWWNGDLWMAVDDEGATGFTARVGVWKWIAGTLWQLELEIPVNERTRSDGLMLYPTPTQLILLYSDEISPDFASGYWASTFRTTTGPWTVPQAVNYSTDVPAYFGAGQYGSGPIFNTFVSNAYRLSLPMVMQDWRNFSGGATKRVLRLLLWDGGKFNEVNAGLWDTSTGWAGDTWMQHTQLMGKTYIWQFSGEYMVNRNGTWLTTNISGVNPYYRGSHGFDLALEAGNHYGVSTSTWLYEMNVAGTWNNARDVYPPDDLDPNMAFLINGYEWLLVGRSDLSGIWADPVAVGIPTTPSTTGERESRLAVPGVFIP